MADRGAGEPGVAGDVSGRGRQGRGGRALVPDGPGLLTLNPQHPQDVIHQVCVLLAPGFCLYRFPHKTPPAGKLLPPAGFEAGARWSQMAQVCPAPTINPQHLKRASVSS